MSKSIKDIASALLSFKKELGTRHVGRHDVVDTIMLALVTKHHAVFIGPPGTDKSNVIEDACKMLDVPFFSYLMTKFTRPEEINGPVNVKKLKDESVIEYNVTGMLPDCKIAFLDEIFKSSSAIQNAILKIMNERKIVNGGKVVTIPLWSLFSASNELPQEEGLEAAYDRFLFRVFVDYLDSSFLKELLVFYTGGKKGGVSNTFDFTIIEEARDALDTVSIPAPVIQSIVDFFKECEHDGIMASDRRKVRSTLALKANALMDGRDVVNTRDFSVLTKVAASSRDDVPKITGIIAKFINKDDVSASKLKDFIVQAASKIAVIEAMTSLDDVINEATIITSMKRNIATDVINSPVDVKEDIDKAIKDVEATVAKKLMELKEG